MEMGDWDLMERFRGIGHSFFDFSDSARNRQYSAGETSSSQGTVSAPVTSNGQDHRDAVTSQGGLQAFPVIKGNSRTGLTTKTVMGIRDKVAQHGLGSQEVMHMIHILNSEPLVLYDIRYIAQVLFQPIQFEIFEDNWSQIPIKVAGQNSQLRQEDSRFRIGPDLLTGIGNFSNPDSQVTFHLLMLEQCQRTGFAALMKTIELSAPKQKFATIVQGPKEPYMQFIEILSASLEKQVDEPDLRRLLLTELARSNASDDCKRIIQALPGDPSVAQMAQACANMGTPDCKVAALVTALPGSSKGQKGKQQKQETARATEKQGKQKQKGKAPSFLCAWCRWPNHFAEACTVKFETKGQPLPDQGNTKLSSKGKHAQT
ncbi:endogenous retrovirus group K member 113 Gag polyprotein-like [Cyanistes caeruleus]|uniref:endogenous retrovirus group K member 113 Gag polyprotein-like n=1 Tax=Cyanistes caeruleus TaxID=156563 RepID=UPI000CDA85FC|nr:endogenous retrovirus group K member 113 Gag polyprotein-like [Cyanistes caeruleus]